MSEEKKNSKLMENLFKIPLFKKLKNVKHIEIIICIIFIGLLLLIYFYGFSGTFTKTTQTSVEEYGELNFTSSTAYAKEMESKLCGVIQNIKGVGNVKVMISVASGGEIIIANSVEEKSIVSSDGESKNVTTVKTPIIVTDNGTSKPIILMEILPKIQGVIVVASGAEDVNIKLNIISAVETITEISSKNIQVFAGK